MFKSLYNWFFKPKPEPKKETLLEKWVRENPRELSRMTNKVIMDWHNYRGNAGKDVTNQIFSVYTPDGTINLQITCDQLTCKYKVIDYDSDMDLGI